MGLAVIDAISEDSEITVSGLVEASGHPGLGRIFRFRERDVVVSPQLPRAPGAVVVEFSTPEATLAHARDAVVHSYPLVIGTTGLSEKEQLAVEHAARKVAVVQSANFSAGICLLNSLVASTIGILGADADIEIVEAHHNRKKDSPSGTALSLANTIREARKGSGETVHGRRGEAPRSRGEIGIHSIRGGDITGDHTVLFAMAGERLELTHRAQSRMTFARGALRAAKFAKSAGPGLYSFACVLGLSRGQ